MKKRSTLGRITNFAITKPWLVIATWLLVIILAGFFTTRSLGDALTTAQEFTSDPESQIAGDILSEKFSDDAAESGGELVVIKSNTGYPVQSPEFQAITTKLVSELRSQDAVERVVNFYESPSPELVSRDQLALLIPVSLEGDFVAEEKSVPQIIELTRRYRSDDFEVRITGPASISSNFSTVSEEDLRKGEVYGLPVTLVILIGVFGTIVAALIPLFLSLIAIAVAVGLTALVGSQFDPFSFFVVNMITMMGLAVGVDYSLFIVSRFREERAGGVKKELAILKAGTTAGRAVLFSGVTVILALCGLFLVPMNIFQGLAAGATFVVVAAVLSALTLLPALLSLLGDRINIGRVGPEKSQANERGGFWDRLTGAIMNNPARSLIFAIGFMLLLAYPALDLQIGASGISSMPKQLEARQAYDLLKSEFAVGLVSPATLVVDGEVASEPANQAVQSFRQMLQERSEFGPSLVTTSADGQVIAIRFPINADATSQQAEELVKELRGSLIPSAFANAPVSTYLGGEAAGNHDFIQLARDNTTKVFGFVLGLSFLLLLVVFRSIIVPLKAIVMNLLSVAAAYGMLVLVFQKGIGNDLLGFGQVEKIEAWLPLFLFCVLFGLSMDYHVFLLSRIRERFLKSGDNTESVAFGVRTTAGLITGAALIMVAVFAAFAAGDLTMFKQMGFGMAVAILLDATIVRSFLVPASMRLLGELNWYLPKFLSWLPDISIESEAHEETESRPRRK